MFFTAGALALVWPPFGLTWLAWVALVPFLGAIERAPSPLHAAVQGGWLALGFGALTLAPIATAYGSYQGVGAVGGVVAAVLTGVVFQLVWPVFAAARRAWPTGTVASLGAAGLYAGLDAVIPKPFGDTLGLAFYDHAWLRQVADLGGPWVLTFVIVLVNEAAHRLYRDGPAQWTRHRPALAVAAGAVVLTTLYGAIRHAQWSDREARAPGRLSVVVVQGNLPLEVRERASTGDDPASEQIIEAYLEASRAALRGSPADLVVWPETTYPGLFRMPVTEAQAQRNVAVDRFVQQAGQPLVLGTYLGEEVDGQVVQYNGIVALTPREGGRVPIPELVGYRKRELVPFGETVPGLGNGPTARAWFPHVSFFGRGPGPVALPVDLKGQRVVLGPSVCYEDLFVRIPLTEVDLGAEVLLNVSHDGWFGHWSVRQIHLAHAVFRSVEVRRPQIRSATSGISALVSATGDRLAEGPEAAAAVVRGTLATGLTGSSPIRATGPGLAPALWLGLAGWVFVRGRLSAAGGTSGPRSSPPPP
ncbi:MAG: apolipoprotein N-acyltransferase [Myxococcota bacterium]